MINKIACVLLVLLTNHIIIPVGNAQLFRIYENGKFGFTDIAGTIVIEPKFLSANDFSEGLASVRINGTYGFINEKGQFVIKPQFDYATFFSEGLAVVYKDGTSYYIDKKGEKAFNLNFPSITTFHNGRAKVGTKKKRQGYIDSKGAIVIEPKFSVINPFIDGTAVVKKMKRKKNGRYETKVGVIDSFGKFVIPYGKYDEISDLENGYFRAVSYSGPGTTFLDKAGTILFFRKDTNQSFIAGNFNCGLAKIYLYKYWIPEAKGVISTSNKGYQGFIDLKGNVVINDTTYQSVEDFADNRAIVKDDNFHYSVINKQGKILKTFDRIITPGYKNGIAIASIDDNWGLIDTNANFIIKPIFDGIKEIGLVDDYFFFEKDNDSTDEPLVGVAKKDGSIIVQPIIQQIDNAGYVNGLLKCLVSNKLTYINKKGEVVWQQKEGFPKGLSAVNIDHMNRGYFYAGSKQYKNDLGGFGHSNNTKKTITYHDSLNKNALSVVVKTNLFDTFENNYRGIKVFVVNTSTDTILFNAQDSRLYMQVQALNTKNEWKDIEYLPSSWCGNSYHTLTLEPSSYWSFTTPEYSGDYKTKLRIKLAYIYKKSKTRNRSKDKVRTIYSNEYDGSVNPGQFWRKQDYYPSGLMDPYND